MSDVYCRKPGIIFRLQVSEGESGKAFNPQDDMLYEFNDISADILSLIDGQRSVEEIVAELKIRYVSEEPDDVENDVIAFLLQLRESQLITLLG